VTVVRDTEAAAAADTEAAMCGTMEVRVASVTEHGLQAIVGGGCAMLVEKRVTSVTAPRSVDSRFPGAAIYAGRPVQQFACVAWA